MKKAKTIEEAEQILSQKYKNNLNAVLDYYGDTATISCKCGFITCVEINTSPTPTPYECKNCGITYHISNYLEVVELEDQRPGSSEPSED